MADLDLIRAVAAGQQVTIHLDLLDRVAQVRQQALHVLRQDQAVYGVNTGMGKLSSIRLTEREQSTHQRNLLLARAVGGPPYLTRAEARAVIMTRLLTFLNGDAAVSPGLCRQLAADLNAGQTPDIPRDGMGAAGEITHLAHAFAPLATRYELGPKEGIALIQGVPGSTALATLRLAEAVELTGLMTRAAALSITAIRATRDPYQHAVARGDEVHARVLDRIRDLTGDEPEPRSLQAPVSFRVVGPVLANVIRAADALEEAVRRALTGVTDSPAFLDGHFTGTAGFHGIDLSAHSDQLTAALTHAAEVSSARMHRLMDPAVTGLNAQLARNPGPDAGLSPVHKRAVGEIHAMRRLTSATATGLIETSAGQEDVQSFSWEATEKLRQAIGHAQVVTACELLAAFQAFRLSGRPSPAGNRQLVDRLAILIPPITADRPFGEDLTRILARMVVSGSGALPLLPLDGGGGLAGHVDDDAVDFRYLVGDAGGDPGDHRLRQARPVGGHRVLAGHRPQHDRMAV